MNDVLMNDVLMNKCKNELVMKTNELRAAMEAVERVLSDNANALVQTHVLRSLVKRCEEQITSLSDEALQEAASVLGAEGRVQGEFSVPDGAGRMLRFQLQRTEVYDMSRYQRYTGEEAVRWRAKKMQSDTSREYAKALTREMKAITDSFALTHPEWEPDEVKLTVKCLEKE